ncbi:MAG: DUF1189 domain-containing protein [Roseburia sp.]|nr:DUF1189 domain-containing protein [Roseburia sp.]
MNIFQQGIASVAGVKGYSQLNKQKGGKTVLYVLLLTFLYAFCFMGIDEIKLLTIPGGFHYMIDRIVPEFELKDGVLSVSEVIDWEEGGTLLSIDTEEAYLSQYTTDDFYYLLKDYNAVILVDSHTIVAKSRGEVQMVSFAQLGLTCNKAMLHGWVVYVYMGMVFLFLCVWMGTIGTFLFGTLCVTLAGMIMNALLPGKLTFGQIFKLSVYSRTLTVLLKAILAIPGWVFGGYALVSVLVSVVYLVLAMKYISDEANGQPSVRQGGMEGQL